MTYQEQMKKWAERREQIVSMCKLSTAAEVGRQIGISRERVRQIVQASVKNRTNGASKPKKRRVSARHV